MIRLINQRNTPPGHYYYRFLFVDGIETAFYGKPDTTNAHTFGYYTVADGCAETLRLFRKANHLPRATFGEAMADLDHYTCQRLENESRWCYEDTQTTNLAPLFDRQPGCRTCGKQT